MEHIIAQDSKIKYIPSFDSLRGLAALFVLLLHGSYGFFSGGFIGVDLFFVLSGYLITSILYHEYRTTKGISFSKFYIRRAIRLFPPLLICIGLANLLWYFGLAKPVGNEILATVASLFYFSNYISGAFLGNMAHLWSLSVEEHFYLFWPLLMVFFAFKAPDKNRMYFFIFILILIAKGLIGLVAPLTLIFYGLSLYIASKFTFDDIKILGLVNICLGLISSYFIGYGLLFWALGFGVGHIVYGVYVHFKYEK